MSMLCGVGIAVPVDKELPANEIENVVKRSKASAVIYSAKKKEVIKKIKDNLPEVEYFIGMYSDEAINEKEVGCSGKTEKNLSFSFKYTYAETTFTFWVKFLLFIITPFAFDVVPDVNIKTLNSSSLISISIKLLSPDKLVKSMIHLTNALKGVNINVKRKVFKEIIKTLCLIHMYGVVVKPRKIYHFRLNIHMLKLHLHFVPSFC